MGGQGIILSCLLRLKTSCRFEFPHLCLQCTTHYSFISFLTATAEKNLLDISIMEDVAKLMSGHG